MHVINHFPPLSIFYNVTIFSHLLKTVLCDLVVGGHIQ